MTVNFSKDGEKKEKARIRTRAWYAKNRDYARARALEYAASHREEARQRARAWHAANLERHKANAAAYRAANKERLNEETRRWKKNNMERVLASVRTRKALKRGVRGKHTASDIANLLIKQSWKCALCGVDVSKKRHVDHIVPLCAGGSNEAHNLQILCPTCNLSKGRKVTSTKDTHYGC